MTITRGGDGATGRRGDGATGRRGDFDSIGRPLTPSPPRPLPPPPLRILHLVSSLQVGGMEQFVLRLAKEQQQRGHQVAVLGLRGGPLLDQARALGVETAVLEGGKIRRTWRTLELMTRRHPDIAHAHNPSALSYAFLARFAVRAPVMMTRHGQESKRINRGPLGRSPDAIVAVSQAVARSMQAKYPDLAPRISVVTNGVHLGGAHRCRSEVRTGLGLSDEMVGIIVARLDRCKGHDCLFRALHLLREQKLPTTMLVVGDGPERENLVSLAHQLELGPDRLRLLGYRSDITDLLAAADFFVLPSLSEGLPLSILEAMAQSLPVVATPVGGIPEVITDGEDGLLVPVDQPETLAAALARLIRDPALRRSLGETAFQHARDRFSFEHMAEQYEALYRRLLTDARAPAPVR